MLLDVRELSFDYPGRRALDALSFAVAPGSVTALVGPNGAGKTTLLRCLAGLERPAEGMIALDGLDVLKHPRRAHRRLGFLQDLFGLYDQLTVLRCLTYHAAARGVPRRQRADQVRRVAEEVGLDDRLHQRAGALSRGLRQRLAVAQAIIHDPALVLLDEPAAGLDIDARAALSLLIRRLAARGVTLIVSSHILSELEDYSSHMLMLVDGRLIDHRPIGRADAVARRFRLDLLGPVEPQLPRIATLIGGIPVVAGAHSVTFALAGGDEAAAMLLRRLVQDGLEVSGFGEMQQSMQQVYRERLEAAG